MYAPLESLLLQLSSSKLQSRLVSYSVQSEGGSTNEVAYMEFEQFARAPRAFQIKAIAIAR